jgi:RNA polymerase primary sigma factor
MQALAEQSRIVRLPLNKIGSINKIRKIYARLEQGEQRMPTNKEIAKQLDMTETEVALSLKISGRHVSMDAPFREGENSNLYNVLQFEESPKPDKNLMQQSLSIEINRALKTLPKKEANVLKMFYGINLPTPYSLTEIGEFFDLSKERVRQVKQKALRRLQHKSKTHLLKTYLG